MNDADRTDGDGTSEDTAGISDTQVRRRQIAAARGALRARVAAYLIALWDVGAKDPEPEWLRTRIERLMRETPDAQAGKKKRPEER